MSCRIVAVGKRGKARGVPLARLVLGLVLGLLGTGCDWLFDKEPPVCHIVAPADSAMVSGIVLVQASAFDSSAVTCVDFYADGAMFASDSTESYSGQWDTQGLVEHSWHSLYCVAYDFAGNAGYSETVHVEITSAGGRAIYHGRIDLASGYYFPVGFLAEPGDTLAGDFRVQSGGNLSSFLWLDKANYDLFRNSAPYTPLLREDNRAELSVSRAVATSDSFYLVFLNTGGSQVSLWVRFSVE